VKNPDHRSGHLLMKRPHRLGGLTPPNWLFIPMHSMGHSGFFK
jgi:hypothetical protein